MTRPPARGEAGQTLLLLIGFAVVVLLLVALVVDASAAYLRRQQLDALADGAALAATRSVQSRQVYTGGLGRSPEVDPQQARQRVRRYLQAVSAEPGLRWEVRVDGATVAVRVSTPLQLPFSPPGWQERVRLAATATSRVLLSD